MDNCWYFPDIEGMLNSKEESTTSANAGAYEVPLGMMPGGQAVNPEEYYIIDPDYLEFLGISPEELFRRK